MNSIEKENLINELQNDFNFKDIDQIEFVWCLLEESQWGKSKAKGIRNSCYQIFYEVFKERLLARVFYIEQGYEYKERYTIIAEVQRYLGGLDVFISRNIYFGSFGVVKYNRYDPVTTWEECKLGTKDIERNSSWYGKLDDVYYNIYDALDSMKNTVHKYLVCDEFMINSNLHLFGMLDKYEKYPQVEMFLKMGILDKIDNYRYVKKNKKGVNCLGIEKNELKYIQSGIKLSMYKTIRKTVLEYNLDVKQAKYLSIHYEVLKYLIDKNFKKTIDYLSSKDIPSASYRDYRDWVVAFGLPNSNKILYPSDFKTEHDKLMWQVEEQKDEVKNSLIREYSKELEKYIFFSDDYLITPARSRDDLVEESRVLEHCVRTYTDKVAKRTTSIFLIRKREEPNQPYVTLELRDKNVIQCRAKNNNRPIDEVIDFVNSWCDKFRFKTCF